MRAIATNDPARTPAALPQVWDGVSPALAAILLKHRDQRLGPTERLRYRSMTGAGTPARGSRPASPAASAPARDLARLVDPAAATNDRARHLPHRRRDRALRARQHRARSEASTTAGPARANTQRMVKFGRLVTADPHGTAILAALCALADSLDRDGAPIDYERRRKLASRDRAPRPPTPGR